MSTDLDAAIEEVIRSGERNPTEITRRIIEIFGEEWVWAQIVARAEEFLTDVVRRHLGQARRSAELALIPDETSSAAMRRAQIWIPSVGWKVAADVTSEDLRKRAEWYANFASAARRRERWCRTVADMMDAEGAPTLADLTAPLPALTDTPLRGINK